MKAVEASEEMWTALYSSFGPDGRAVLAQSPSRLTITRSGSLILNLVFLRPNPVLSLLLDSANNLHDVAGDGVKSFVILVKALLKKVAFNASFVYKLLVLQTQLSLSFPTTCSCVLTNDVLNNVIKTFFSTRFSPVVSKTLSSLVSNLVSKLDSISDIDRYVEYFSLLCPKFSPFPVSSSCIQDGLLIKGHWVKRFPHTKVQSILKVYYHSLETSPEDGEVEMDITDILKDESKNVLFVTNIFLPDRAQYLLNIKNVFFIHATCSDTAKFLFELSLQDNIIVEWKPVNDYLWISLPIHQLLLKSPSESLASEYAEGILDCLKMLKFSFKKSNCTVAAGGLFEFALAKKLFNLSDNSKRLPPVKSRDQLMAWRKPFPEEADLLKHLNLKCLEGMDSEVVDVVCQSLFALQSQNSDSLNAFEPVVLRMEILCKAINLIASICRIDGAILKPKKGRLC